MQPAEAATREFCTHREVKPYAGTAGFDAEAWCPECVYYKLRRAPKKRNPDDYVRSDPSTNLTDLTDSLRTRPTDRFRDDSRVGRVPRSGPGDSVRKFLRQIHPLPIGRQLL